jgi:hypothetical protein
MTWRLPGDDLVCSWSFLWHVSAVAMREHEKDFDEAIPCCFSVADKALYDRLLAGA